MSGTAQIGVVAIGRNEGERLEACLRSAQAQAARVVYVDSGSTDESVALAQRLGVDTVELDPARPFTAARGRNEGLAALMALGGIDRVQFVDGDCEIVPGWIHTAADFLDAHPEVDVVCGRRRERFPDASPYNRLADIEWDTPIGEAAACGGDALMRAARVQEVGGYDETLIAGEDPELCTRIRRAGGRIWRIDAEMTLHDADLLHFSQWWQRMKRSGHAYAEFAHRYAGASGEARSRRIRSILFWGAFLPGLLLVSAVVALPLAALVGLLWLAQGVRLFLAERKQRPAKVAALYAGSILVGKIAEAVGVATYGWRRVRGKTPQLIEYKGAADDAER